ncbi:MAG: hypothetical protein IKQ75_06945 [Bacteroidales bacterium]|nr:hypothetical protein [Bacteroidales bacterium]
MNESSASQTIHQLNRFRMDLAVLLPLSALLTPKDPSVYLSKWGVAAVTLYTLGCLSILCGDFLRTKWKIVDDNDIKENNIANWLFATGIIGYLIVCYLVKDHYLSHMVLGETWFEGGVAFVFILLIRFITRAICETRWGKFTGIHTVLNKIAGYSLMFYIPLKTLGIRLFWLNNSISSFDDWVLSGIYFIGIFWLIYLVASVEELIIAVVMKERFDPFRKSIFQKRQQ